jgi:hypothetical protein
MPGSPVADVGAAGSRNIHAAIYQRQSGDGQLKPLEDAPGSYVKVRAWD